MMLEHEDPKTVCRLAAILCTNKPGAHVVVVTDTPRVVDASYVSGPDGLYALMRRMDMTVTYFHSSQQLRLGNGSKVTFMPIRSERDEEKMMGMEADMVVIDHRAIVTNRIITRAKLIDRRGVTLEHLKKMAA